MEIGFFFWPYDVALVEAMAGAADRFGYDMVGVADTPGNAMDPWVAATLVVAHTRRARVALCVTNLVTRHPAVSAAAVASIDMLAPGRTVLGIGVGHSGTRNLGAPSLAAGDLADGVTFVKTLLRGAPASYRGAPAHLPWVKQPSPVFLAASHPRSLRGAGATADGVFINFGLGADNVRASEATVVEAAQAAGRDAREVEIWQIACLDCHEDGDAARRKIGAILAFVSAYIMGSGGDLSRRGVPEEYRAPLQELRRRSSTRPGDADAALVAELGLFDYLSRRLAVCGTPDECLAQVRAAQANGVRRLMFTVSLATDPVRTVQLFGEKVLPALRASLP